VYDARPYVVHAVIVETKSAKINLVIFFSTLLTLCTYKVYNRDVWSMVGPTREGRTMPATIEAAPVVGECECGTCDRTYSFEESGAEFSDQCPACQVSEEEQARAEEAREELIDEAQGELEEAEGDLEGLLAELADIRERIAEAKAAIKAGKDRLAKLTA
jgi:hypothetical protein